MVSPKKTVSLDFLAIPFFVLLCFLLNQAVCETILSVRKRTESGVLFEAGREIQAVGKAAALSNSSYRNMLAVRKELLCIVYAYFREIFQGRLTRFFFEAASEIVLVKVGF